MKRVVSKVPYFIGQSTQAIDRVLNNAAVDIARASKDETPYWQRDPSIKGKGRTKGGQLRASQRVERKGLMHFEVSYNTPYARYQEFGGDARRRVKRYSTAGTKAHYLADPGNAVKKGVVPLLQAELSRLKV